MYKKTPPKLLRLFFSSFYGSIRTRNFKIFVAYYSINSQAPVTPELATKDVFRLSRISVNTFSKTLKNRVSRIFSNYSFSCKIPVKSTKRFWKLKTAIFLIMVFHSKISFETFIVIEIKLRYHRIMLFTNHREDFFQQKSNRNKSISDNFQKIFEDF